MFVSEISPLLTRGPQHDAHEFLISLHGAMEEEMVTRNGRKVLVHLKAS